MTIKLSNILSKTKNMSNKRKFGTVLLFLIIVTIFLLRGKEDSTKDELSVKIRIPVVVTPCQSRIFKDTLVVQGNLEAKNFSMVSPRIPGTIEMIFVDEGKTVVADQTKLFQTDALKLNKTVEIREHELEVAGFEKRKLVAELERVEVDLHKSEIDFNRFERLFAKDAVTADAFEQKESHYKQLQALRKFAQAQMDLAVAKERQAKAFLSISQKDLTDTIVYAPINGKISGRFQEQGEMGNPGKPVFRIDDTSLIEVSAYLPAQYYSKIIPGKTYMNVKVSGIELDQQTILYKSPTINHKLRTFEIKCDIKNPSTGVVPGAMAHITVVLEEREGLGVPSPSILKRGGRQVVFVIEDNISRQVLIRAGLENNGWTEIVDGELVENVPVVSMGQSMIEEGTLVSVQKKGK